MTATESPATSQVTTNTTNEQVAFIAIELLKKNTVDLKESFKAIKRSLPYYDESKTETLKIKIEETQKKANDIIAKYNKLLELHQDNATEKREIYEGLVLAISFQMELIDEEFRRIGRGVVRQANQYLAEQQQKQIKK